MITFHKENIEEDVTGKNCPIEFGFDLDYVEDGVHETPFGYFMYSNQKLIAESFDGLIWDIIDSEELVNL